MMIVYLNLPQYTVFFSFYLIELEYQRLKMKPSFGSD